MHVIARSSPNFGPRRRGTVPDLVLIHYTGMETAEAALRRMCDPAAEVSAHYLVGADGRVWALVDEAERAWHAGAGSWGGRADVNSRSIGIEIENPGPLAALPPFPAPAMDTVVELVAGVRERWQIPPERVLAHSDTAPARKADPGPKFDWRRLARAGQAVWPDAAAPASPDRFAADAGRFGYPVAEAGAAAVLAAVRLRFRHGTAAAAPDAIDAGIVAELARRYPCVDVGMPAA